MSNDKSTFEIPDGWNKTAYRLTGNFKLVAEFQHEATKTIVRVTPHKTYTDQPGFCNAHRVILVHPEDGVEEIAVGMEVEHVEDAEEVARTAMRAHP